MSLFFRTATLQFILFTVFGFTLYAQTPLAANGRLQLVGNQLSNSCGLPVQLRGMSSHGVQWFPTCIDDNALTALRDEWGSDVVRLAMYVESNGYLNDPSYWRSWIDDKVEDIGQLGMYCLIDWHILSDGDPWTNIEASREFWEYMSAQHKDKEHVIYEICNEPNGVEWPRIKSYAEDIIPRIRANDPEAIIVVGTPLWSGEPWEVVGNELTGDNAYNVMYTYHFYSGSHGGRRTTFANVLDDLPVFVTEWGTSSASGDDGFNASVTDAYMDVMNGDNPGNVLVSWCNWSFADKDEVSAALLPGSCSQDNWTATSESGTLVKYHMSNPADNFLSCAQDPQISIQPTGLSVVEGEPFSMTVVAFGDNLNFQWYLDGQPVSGATSATYSVASSIESQEGNYTVVVSNSYGDIESHIATLNVLTPGPYWGTPVNIPGIIQAEEYDVGEAGVAYFDGSAGNTGGLFRSDDVDIEAAEDENGGYNVGWIADNEWLKYQVNVTETGTYDFSLRVASNSTGGQCYLDFDGVNITGVLNVPTTDGWQSWQTITSEGHELTAGEHELVVHMPEGSFNLNWIKAELEAVGLQELFDKGLLTVGPNPVQERLKFVGDVEVEAYEIQDLQGKTWQEGELKNKALEVGNLTSGVYFLTLHGPQGAASVKIFKQ